MSLTSSLIQSIPTSSVYPDYNYTASSLSPSSSSNLDETSSTFSSSTLPTSTESPNQAQSGSSYVNSKIIIAIVFSIIAFFVLLILIIYALCRRRRRRSRHVDDVLEGKVVYLKGTSKHKSNNISNDSSELQFLSHNEDPGRAVGEYESHQYRDSTFNSPMTICGSPYGKEEDWNQTPTRKGFNPLDGSAQRPDRIQIEDPDLESQVSESPTSTLEMSFGEWERRREEANSRLYNPHEDIIDDAESQRIRNPYDDIRIDGSGPEEIGGRPSESQRTRDTYLGN